jgi:4-amino-4-deoxy-L-arabinose transferase-like glycosyltransferase
MNLNSRPSPARVSAAAARPLPRAALLALLAVFIGSGLIGRDPWYQEDAAGFGVMWTMAHGTVADWLLPNVAGEYVADGGPLDGWIGALLIRLFGGWLGDALAARLTVVLWFTIATAAVWYATYRLARRDEAQPVAFAFGGEARPRDYGRMLADIAVLLSMGTLGQVLRMHETTDLAASVALIAVTLFGLALALERAWSGALVVGVSLGLLALARGPQAAAFAALGALLALPLTLPRAARWRAAALSLATAGAVFAAWPLLAMRLAPEAARGEFLAAWTSSALAFFAVPRAVDLGWLLRTLAWYVWPLWPFALWALYAWRHGLARPHTAQPAILAAVLLAGALAAPQTEPPLLLLAAPLAVLAAFGAVSVRRAAENAIDWFSIVTVSFFGLVGWAYFIAMMTGSPPKMAASIARLTPGYTPHIGAIALALALAATAGWIALVIWRAVRQPEPLWRGPLLAAGGLTALWFMLNVLFLPAINYARSYEPLAQSIREQIDHAGGAQACVVAYQLRPAHRAMLAYHGGIRFGTAHDDCPLALQRDLRRTRLDDAPPPGDWRQIWEGRWPPRPDETFRLFRRGPG